MKNNFKKNGQIMKEVIMESYFYGKDKQRTNGIWFMFYSCTEMRKTEQN